MRLNCDSDVLGWNGWGYLSSVRVVIAWEVSMRPADKATTVPSKGVRKKSMPAWAIALIVVSVVFASALVAMLLWQSRNVPIDADVRYNGTLFYSEFTIQNNDSYDYTDVHLTLNKVYYRGVGTIPAGETRHISISEFKKKGGVEFNAYDTTIETLYLDCQTPDGKCHREWTFSE